jgi:NitT/TauT family transport system substrate-binding protein
MVLALLDNCLNTESRFHQNITIATLRGPSAISMINMIDNTDSSLHYNFIIKDEPNQVKSMMLNGEADFAILPSTMAAILYNKGLQYKLAAIPVWGTLYLLGNENIRKWQDLTNKRVYMMEKGATPDIVFKLLLLKNGLDPDKDVILDYSFPTHIELAKAVISGRANLAVISEPMVSLVIPQNTKIKPIFDFNKEWKRVMTDSIPFAQTALLVKNSLADKHPEQLERFLKLYKACIYWIFAKPDSAAALIVKHKILPDSSVARSCIPRCNIKLVLTDSIKTGIIRYFKVFYDINHDIIGGKLPDENFFYKSQNHHN